MGMQAAWLGKRSGWLSGNEAMVSGVFSVALCVIYIADLHSLRESMGGLWTGSVKCVEFKLPMCPGVDGIPGMSGTMQRPS